MTLVSQIYQIGKSHTISIGIQYVNCGSSRASEELNIESRVSEELQRRGKKFHFDCTTCCRSAAAGWRGRKGVIIWKMNFSHNLFHPVFFRCSPQISLWMTLRMMEWGFEVDTVQCFTNGSDVSIKWGVREAAQSNRLNKFPPSFAGLMLLRWINCERDDFLLPILISDKIIVYSYTRDMNIKSIQNNKFQCLFKSRLLSLLQPFPHPT